MTTRDNGLIVNDLPIRLSSWSMEHLAQCPPPRGVCELSTGGMAPVLPFRPEYKAVFVRASSGG